MVASRIDGAPYDTSVVDVLAAAPGVAAALIDECRRFLGGDPLDAESRSAENGSGAALAGHAGHWNQPRPLRGFSEAQAGSQFAAACPIADPRVRSGLTCGLSARSARLLFLLLPSTTTATGPATTTKASVSHPICAFDATSTPARTATISRRISTTRRSGAVVATGTG